MLTSLTDLAWFLVFGRDITQLCAWSVIGNAYNIEGHSALSIFYIGSDFHDRHHTRFRVNYGIQGFWDKVFGTHDVRSTNLSLLFPANRLEHLLTMRQHAMPCKSKTIE